MQSIKGLVDIAKASMTSIGKGEYLIDVDWLMMAVLGIERPEYLMKQSDIIEDQQRQVFESYMKQRIAGEPLQYILSHQSFYGYDYYVDHRVLIPRFETEELVEKVVSIIHNDGLTKVMDLCSGSGCIGLTILKECEEVKATLVDISKDALEVAKINGKNLDVLDRCIYTQSNLLEEIDDSNYDVIVSNPPYIETEVISTLSHEVKVNEPALALDGGVDGLDFYRRIVKDSKGKLNKDGYLFFEIGYNQMNAVINMMIKEGYYDVEGYKDLSGLDRMVVGRYR